LNQKVVFVVDDEDSLADAVALFLGEHGFKAIAFPSPVDALVASASHKPDLLLTDYRMPVMDGLALAVSVTERHPDCKVLLMTAAAHAAEDRPAFSRFEVLHKPFTLAFLLGKVVELLG